MIKINSFGTIDPQRISEEEKQVLKGYSVWIVACTSLEQIVSKELNFLKGVLGSACQGAE